MVDSKALDKVNDDKHNPEAGTTNLSDSSI
jgi:hypothetical protein